MACTIEAEPNAAVGASGRSWLRRRTTRVVVELTCVALVALTASCARDQGLDQTPIDETRRLAGLGQVWGLLKYYHPQVAGRTDWDSALLSYVPRVKAADTRGAFNREILDLVAAAGSLDGSPADTPLDALFRWIDDPELFLPDTSVQLRRIVSAHRPGANLYVSPVNGVHNPDFTGDRGLSTAPQFPDEPTRLLALFRYWNMVQYFYPYRDGIDRPWRDILPDLIPKFEGATNAVEYHVAVAEMTASIIDAHAATYSPVLYGYFGMNSVPIQVRLVENRSVITRVFPRLLDSGAGLRVGDVVTRVGSADAETRRALLRKVLNGSNAASLERNVHDCLVRTNDTHLLLAVEGADGQTSARDANTVALGALASEQGVKGEVSKIFSGNVGYVNMGWLQVADVAGVMEQLRRTRAIVSDVRNYPNGTLYALSNYLNPTMRPFAKFLEPGYDHPGLFLWTSDYFTGPGSGWPLAPYTYTGRVVILVNQETQSHAEFTVMALQTAPDVTVIGSQTAGADGNVSRIDLPGGIITYFTGLGVFYPDGTPTQRVGIVPNIVAKPTIRGLREGRDEVLETALTFLR